MKAGRSKRMGTVLLWGALLLLVLVQIGSNLALRPLRPAIEEMPYPLSPLAMRALALGDDQFLFRTEISWLQSVGDGGGRVRPLKDYDYGRIIDWMRLIDGLDLNSQSIYALGSNYFGAILDPVAGPPKIKLVAQYFVEAGVADPARRWPWLVWAAVKIQRTVKDPDLARNTADSISTLPQSADIPDWIPLLEMPLYRVAGEKEKAAALAASPDMIARRRRVASNFKTRMHELGFDKYQQP